VYVYIITRYEQCVLRQKRDRSKLPDKTRKTRKHLRSAKQVDGLTLDFQVHGQIRDTWSGGWLVCDQAATETSETCRYWSFKAVVND